MLSRARTWTLRWLKRLLITLLAAPLVNMSLVTTWAKDDTISRIVAITIYVVTVWVVIIVFAGYKKFINYISFAAVMVVSTAVIGLSMQAALKAAFGVNWFHPLDPAAEQEKTFSLVVMLIVSIPYALFLIQSFSVSNAIERISRFADTSSASRIKVAVCLRVLQHMGETFSSLITVWRESNPAVYSPRHRDDWINLNFIGRALQAFSWLGVLAQMWARALLVLGLRIVPVIEVEFGRITRKR